MGITAARGIFQQAYHITGTLAANVTITFTAPCDCQLLHASACASNDSDATIIIGISADTDEYLQSSVIGDSGVPVEFDADDWYDADGNQPGVYYPHIADGTVVVITLDFDGASGTAAQNVTIVLTFAEG
jgi:hypothetical protein